MFRGLVGMVFLVFIGATLLIGGTLYESDLENGEIRNVYNLTAQINPNFTCNSLDNLNDIQGNIEVPIIHSQRLNKIGCALADFTITTFMEVTKWGVEFGYTHPQYDYNFYFKVVKIWIYALIFSLIIPILIPLIALIYLLVVGIKSLFSKFKKRRIEKCTQMNQN